MRSLIKSETKVLRSTHYTAAPFSYRVISSEHQIFPSKEDNLYFKRTSLGSSDIARQTHTDI